MLGRTLVAALALTGLCLASACGKSQEEESRLLIEMFKIKNPGMSIRKSRETSFITGTVPARAVGFVEDARLKASMACYEWVYSLDGDPNETEAKMCVYYVHGPEGGGGRVWWRGEAKWLKDLMQEQGFKP